MTFLLESLVWIFFTFVTGVCGGNWGVIMESPCALQGTSVVISCQYDYPFAHIVTSVTWSKYDTGTKSWISLESLGAPPDYLYVGNKRGDCSLRINRIRHEDGGYYRFSFVTTFDRWKSKQWAYVSVKDSELTSAVQPSTVTEGDDVQLTCVSGCPTLPDAVWFKDGRRLWAAGRVFQASKGDSGRYQCALKELETVRSTTATLEVQYPPDNVTLSMTPLGAVVKGSSVTFECSCDANPPVKHGDYRLFKDGHLVRSGQSLNVSHIQPSASGRYHCQAWNNLSQRGIQHFNSTIVHLDVQYRPVNVVISMHPWPVKKGGAVNLTCTSDSNPAAENYTWYRKTNPTGLVQQVGSGQLLSLASVEGSHSGLYLCQARNQLGEANSTDLLLSVAEEPDSSHSTVAIAGVGVVLFVALVIALSFWTKQRHKRKVGMKANTDASESFTSQPRLSQDMCEDEVVYTTVTIRDNRHVHHKKSKEREDSAVIYSTVVPNQ